MKIGIDIDNTIVNTSVVSKMFLDKYCPGNNLNSYHDLSKNEELKFFYKYYKDITKNLKVYDGVHEAFDFFKENSIFLIACLICNDSKHFKEGYTLNRCYFPL